MNFLAHCLLAAKATADQELEAGLIAGGLLGDLVKGAIPADWPPFTRLGVQLHRRIDAYSNQHAGIRQSCDRFPAPLRRFAPIFVDVVADHILSLEWRARHGEPLASFSRRCYALAREHRALLDSTQQRYLDWLTDTDLLNQYAAEEVMQRGLQSVTRRLRKPELDPAVAATVHAELGGLTGDFADYFPDLVAHARAFVERTQYPGTPS